MGFNVLYNSGGNVYQNAANIAVYINAFAEKLVGSPIQIDLDALTQVASALQQPDFPHIDGVDKASPFKKAANFFVWFVCCRPIISELPASIIGTDLNGIGNHQNVIFGYDFAVSCLEGATLHKKNEIVTLDNRIKISYHFYRDLIEAFAAPTPSSHFKIASLLFEQLAYKANPGAAYTETI